MKTLRRKADVPHVHAMYNEITNNEAEFEDVPRSDDNNILLDEDNGFYTSPLQQRTASIQLLARQSQEAETTRLRKEVGPTKLGTERLRRRRVGMYQPPLHSFAIAYY